LAWTLKPFGSPEKETAIKARRGALPTPSNSKQAELETRVPYIAEQGTAALEIIETDKLVLSNEVLKEQLSVVVSCNSCRKHAAGTTMITK
jgi:hypothetical protein